MYLPERRWQRQAVQHPEVLAPNVAASLRPEVAARAKQFCSRTRTSSRWFLEEAVLQLIANSERDQWRRFLVRVPESVSAQLSDLASKSAHDAKTVVTRALQAYITERIHGDSVLAQRLANLRQESEAQLPLRFTVKEAG
jgi:predicted transcriptional regulator